jgi:hypothetical protein
MLYVFEGHKLDTDRRELRRDGLPVEVEPQVFDCSPSGPRGQIEVIV